MKKNTQGKISSSSKYFKKNYQLYFMLVIPVLFFALFKYLPMAGTVIAFKDYNIFGEGIFPGDWVGFKHFKEAFSSNEFWVAVKNTFILNMGDLLIGFPIPILLAVALNELRSDKIRKTAQVITYLPNFLSWVIISGIAFQVFSNTGLINVGLANMGMDKVDFLSDPFKWRLIYWISGVWQGAGYSLIIYLASLMSVDTALYEAAYIDGATRMKRIIHITLPMIKPTISMMLIMSLGKIIAIGFDRPYMMSNALVKSASSVISTHVYTLGISSARFDYAAAVGLFQSVIGIIMIVTADRLAKKFGEEGIL